MVMVRMVSFEFPWRRYALIAELAKRLDGVSPQFGKTALEKLVYLFQEVYGIDCGYEFELYSYGPFTSLLLGDLDQVAHFGCVSVEPVHSISGGYEIRPTKKENFLEEKAADFLGDDKTKSALDSLVSDFGRLTAKELELRATIVYVERDMHIKDEKATKDEVCRIVGEIKPKFSKDEIEQTIEELCVRNHIQLTANEKCPARSSNRYRCQNEKTRRSSSIN
jgi:hypothetical protein